MLLGNREEIGLLEHQGWVTHEAGELPIRYGTSVCKSWKLKSRGLACSKEILHLTVRGGEFGLVIISTAVGYSSPGSFSFTYIWKILQSRYYFPHFQGWGGRNLVRFIRPLITKPANRQQCWPKARFPPLLTLPLHHQLQSECSNWTKQQFDSFKSAHLRLYPVHVFGCPRHNIMHHICPCS